MFISDKKLTRRELDIMNILWQENKPLVASEILKYNSTLSISTVQTALRKLIDKKFIEVANIVYSGTVLTRSYHPLITKEEFEKISLTNSIKSLNDKNISLTTFASTFFEIENDSDKVSQELIELEKLINKKKKELLNHTKEI